MVDHSKVKQVVKATDHADKMKRNDEKRSEKEALKITIFS